MAYVSKGRRLMVFIDGTPIALATSHSLTISPSLLEDRTKDDGDAPVAEFDNYTWAISTDCIIGKNNDDYENSIVYLIETMLGMGEVNLAFDASVPATGSVPENGWFPNEKEEDYPYTTGKAWIESISISAGSTGYATATITFKGQGKLS